MRKAYRITTVAGEIGDYSIYSAESAGKAKTMALYDLQRVYGKRATYSWIKRCTRFHSWDNLAQVYSGCIHWKIGNESWTHQFPGSKLPERCILDPMPTR